MAISVIFVVLIGPTTAPVTQDSFPCFTYKLTEPTHLLISLSLGTDLESKTTPNSITV